MKLWLRRFCGMILVGGAFMAPAALAQTGSFSFGNGLGTLTFNVSGSTEPCVGKNGFQAQFTDWSFTGFKYITGENTPQSINGFTTYVQGLAHAQGDCPATAPGRTITFNGSGYTIVITPGPGFVNATITIPGYINPKYVVVSVIYAPPGSKSFVSYSNTSLVSNTMTVTNTFSNSITNTVKVTTPGGLFGFLGGSETQTQSSTLTQQSQNSSSVTSSYTNTQSLELFGPGPNNNCGPQAGDYIGVDHDCDLIKVWLNPVMLFTLTNDGDGSTVVQWNGYGFSSLDTTAPIHIVDILVGCLNGDIAAADSRCSPPLGEFKRTWAAGENWPSGQGPGLTEADLSNVLAADPWGHCTPNSPIGASACPTFSVNSSGAFVLLPPQFSISNLQNVPYTEGSPQTDWMVSTTSSTTQGQDSQTSFSQTFGVEDAFTGTGFLTGFGANVSTSRTLTWKYEVSNQTTVSNTFAGQASITGPACNGNPCSPPYPPNPALYGTGTEFDIFLDHFFGTFVFVPASYQ